MAIAVVPVMVVVVVPHRTARGVGPVACGSVRVAGHEAGAGSGGGRLGRLPAAGEPEADVLDVGDDLFE